LAIELHFQPEAILDMTLIDALWWLTDGDQESGIGDQ
jgi:hypothetical protein